MTITEHIANRHKPLTGTPLVHAVLKDTGAKELALQAGHVQAAKEAVARGDAELTFVGEIVDRLTPNIQERLRTAEPNVRMVFDATGIRNENV